MAGWLEDNSAVFGVLRQIEALGRELLELRPVILDATVVNVALPSIRRDLGFSGQSVSWVLNAYTLMLGGFLPALQR